MIDIKKVRYFTSVLSLISIVLLAIIVVRFSRLPDYSLSSIRLEPPQEQVTQEPPVVVKQPERKLIIPEPRDKSSFPVSVNIKSEKVQRSQVEEPEEELFEDDELLRENVPDMLACPPSCPP